MAKTWFEWDELYDKFESMYNPYPVQMSRSEAFGKARNDGLITDEEYREAQEFYGNLWRYTGDWYLIIVAKEAWQYLLGLFYFWKEK